MSVIELNETFLKKCHIISYRRNTIDVITTDSGLPVTELQKTSLKPNNVERDFEKSSFSVSEKYEDLLILFFKLSYYLGITPYYWTVVEFKNGPRNVESSSSKFHTVIVILVHICAMLRFSMRFCLLSYDLGNPFNYFKIARTTLTMSLCSFFIWSLWRRYSTCKQILDRLANLSFFPNVTCLKRKSVQYPILLTSIGVLCLTSVHRAIEECNSRLEDLCKDDGFGVQTLCEKGKYRFLDILAKVLFCIFNFLGRTTRRIPRMELLAIALTIWQICKSFAKSLKHRGQQQSHYQNHEVMTVLLAYEELKCISNLIRDLVGEMLISEIVEDIVYFSLEVQLRLREAEWFSIFVVIETWLVAFVAYFVASCAAEHIQEVSTWLGRDDVLAKLSPGKVTTLHSQLSANPIGMKGGSLFTLTKSFLANVATVWVTYFIILLQFQIGVSGLPYNDMKMTVEG